MKTHELDEPDFPAPRTTMPVLADLHRHLGLHPDTECGACSLILDRLAERARQADPVGLREAALSVLAADTALAIGQEGSDRLWDEAMQSLADALASLPAQAVEPGPLDVDLLKVLDSLPDNWPYVFPTSEQAHAMRDVVAYVRALSPDKQPKGAG
jgi:hypothetical protein